jgi:Putative quorum-sensing-regulated virulence factor
MNLIRRGGAAPIFVCQRALEFTDKEASLVRLIFDCSASPGEIDNGSVALIRSLRRRYKSGHQLLRDLEQTSAPPPAVTVRNPFADTRMTFGKHRGKRLCDISADYLLWCLDNCRDINPYLRNAIRRYLA